MITMCDRCQGLREVMDVLTDELVPCPVCMTDEYNLQRDIREIENELEDWDASFFDGDDELDELDGFSIFSEDDEEDADVG